VRTTEYFYQPARSTGPHEAKYPVKDKRPRNLDFTTLRLPLPAITSILHRISGVFIFAGIAVLLWLFDESLASAEGFAQVEQWLDMATVKLIVWSIVAGLIYHLLAGIKHLLMDMGIGETLEGGLMGAKLVIVFSIIGILMAGVWLW
jgi:succinate dehydrogenase / fumarate reductase cytochrome b subunit